MHWCTECPWPAAGHYWPMPLPKTPGHSQASLGQSFLGSWLLSPGFWWAQGFVCALQESVSAVPCKFWWLYGGVNGNLLQEGLCHTQVCCTQSPCPCHRYCWSLSPQETLTVLAQSLWRLWVLVHTRFVWALWVSLVGMELDSKCDFTSPTVFLGLPLCPWTWNIFFWWDPTFSCPWLFSSEL